MARRASKVDANQVEVVNGLRQFGASVQTLHAVGMGCPDIVVGFRGRNYLMEIKDGDKPPSATGLTSWREKWHVVWSGQVCIVYSLQDAIDVLLERPVAVPVVGQVTGDNATVKYT